jgi:hypothetical protein
VIWIFAVHAIQGQPGEAIRKLGGEGKRFRSHETNFSGVSMIVTRSVSEGVKKISLAYAF